MSILFKLTNWLYKVAWTTNDVNAYTSTSLKIPSGGRLTSCLAGKQTRCENCGEGR
ncbi:MAG: hypothetical protein ACUZ8E_03940 [Candidatus Anammoxibacter sp.]